MAAPFAQPLAEDQRIVAKPQQIAGADRVVRIGRGIERACRAERLGGGDVFGLDRRKARHQMCFTSSGMS